MRSFLFLYSILLIQIAISTCARIKRVSITNNNVGSGVHINNNDGLSGSGTSIVNNNSGGTITNTNNGASIITNTNTNGAGSTIISTLSNNIPFINIPLLPFALMTRPPKLVMDTYGNLYILRFINGKPLAYYIGNQDEIVLIPTESLIGATTNGKVGTLAFSSNNEINSATIVNSGGSSIVNSGGTSIVNNNNNDGKSITNNVVSGTSSSGGTLSIVNNNGKK
jgi:hypothetical protein